MKRIVYPKAAAAVLALGFSSMLCAQLNSAAQNITVTAQGSESISITLTTGGPVTFTLPDTVAKVAIGSVAPAWTTSWVLSASRTSVKVFAYFSSTTALTGANPANFIPAADFIGVANGGAQTTFSAGAVTAVSTGVGMLVSTTAITSGNLTGSKNDTLALSLVNNSGVFTTDSYTGVLNIQAQATP